MGNIPVNRFPAGIVEFLWKWLKRGEFSAFERDKQSWRRPESSRYFCLSRERVS